MQTIIVFTLGIAIVWLDEEVTPLMWAGIALIMISPAISIKGPRFGKAPGNEGVVAGGANGGPRAISVEAAPTPPVKAVDALSRQKLVEGYTFASLNAIVWGTTPVLIRYGVGGTDLGLVGGLVAYLAAGLLLMPVLLSQRMRESLGSMGGSTAKWLAAATLAITVGVMFRYLALAAAPVTVVAPVMRATAFVQLPLTYLINRQIESFEPRLVASILISIIGGLVIILG
jgi:drug/metabolite transporter (DMT)-like permease